MKYGVPFIAAFLLPATAQAANTAKITLNAGEEPEQKAWTQPASISFNTNGAKKNTWIADIAGKVEWQPVEHWPIKTYTRGVIQRNTDDKKPVEVYAAELGTRFSFDTATSQPDGGPDLGAWYFPGSASIVYSDKTSFPSSTGDCSVTPLPVTCIRQHEKSIRPIFSLQIFRESWQKDFAAPESPSDPIDGPKSGAYLVLPVVTFFYDEIMDAKLDAKGNKPDGGVLGSKVSISGTFSPTVFDYRVVMSAAVQQITALNRAAGRKGTFAKDGTLLTAGITYEFAKRSFEIGSGWVPAIGLSYVKGDDPLAGKIDQKNFVVGLKITYKAE